MTRRQNPRDPADRALLAAVLAAPDEDAPRLVYADRLIERGDPQGELIVLQCTRGEMERRGDIASAEYHRVRLREAEVLAAVRAHWAKSFGSDVPITVERGFIASAYLPIDELRLRWRLVSAHPLRHFSVYGSRASRPGGAWLGELAWLSRKPAVRRASRLTLHSAYGSLDVDPVAFCDDLAAVPRDDATPSSGTELVVGDRLRPLVHGITASSPMADSIHAFVDDAPPQLRSLEIGHATWLPANALAPLTRLEGLRRLSIRLLSAEAAAMLLRAPAFVGLEELVLTPRLGHGEEALIADAWRSTGLLAQLRSLRALIELDADTAAAFDRASSLEHLAIESDVEQTGLDRLMTGSLVPQLRSLEIAAGAERLSAQSLAAAPFTRLETLVLRKVSFDDRTAGAFASAAALATVRDLELKDCNVSPGPLAVLRERWPHLVHSRW